MKKILLSSFFIGFCLMAMAQVKPAAKTVVTVPKKSAMQAAHPNADAAQKAMAEKIAFKNKVIADQAKGIHRSSVPVQKGAAELVN